MATTRQSIHETMIPIEDLTEIFSDLTHLPQDDDVTRHVCVIQYPSSFALAYNYMRAVWGCDETSGELKEPIKRMELE